METEQKIVSERERWQHVTWSARLHGPQTSISHASADCPQLSRSIYSLLIFCWVVYPPWAPFIYLRYSSKQPNCQQNIPRRSQSAQARMYIIVTSSESWRVAIVTSPNICNRLAQSVGRCGPRENTEGTLLSARLTCTFPALLAQAQCRLSAIDRSAGRQTISHARSPTQHALGDVHEPSSVDHDVVRQWSAERTSM
ncbi:hypothetical protein BKA93DRAFT_444777 [Sparassis latifolia]